MSEPSGHDTSAAATASHRIDDACDRFEAFWKAGQRPHLEVYLSAVPDEDRGRLFRELLAVELSYRRAAREQPEHEEYLRRFPQYCREIQAAFQRTPPAGSGQAPQATIDGSGAPRRALRVCCPHCRNPIEVFDDTPLARIVCSSCGSGFSLVGDEALAYKTAGGTPHRRQHVGRFELLEQLGFGGFGAVWRARDTRLDRTVALKIPRKGQLTPDETEKFLREARAAAQLKHPNIVSVHEVGLEDDLVYIVSDFVEGLSLADWLTGQRLTYREAAELCAKIADALHFAHERGITHRDLKPSNIMLDPAGQPHLMDFGLAKRETGEVTMTLDGVPLGTPAYMSPEQAKGEAHQADRRTDVYSLGVILFELLTGERPFRGNVRMLIKQAIEDEPPRPRKLDSHVPRDLETVCLKCLEKDPACRYRTARELAEELRRFLDGQPVQARPVGPLGRAWRWYRRNPNAPMWTAGGYITICSISLSLWGVVGMVFLALHLHPVYNPRQLVVEITMAFVCLYLPMLWAGMGILNGRIHALWVGLILHGEGFGWVIAAMCGFIFNDPLAFGSGQPGNPLFTLWGMLALVGMALHILAIFSQYTRQRDSIDQRGKAHNNGRRRAGVGGKS